MEYIQMTLDEWLEMKQNLKNELMGVTKSFVRIGYALRKIADQRLYEQDGYKTVTEFAEKELGLGASVTSRFMAINKEYSIDGYSDKLRPEYAALGRSQLEEMLMLPEADRAMVKPETAREDIRELKRFNKSEPEEVKSDLEPIKAFVREFFNKNRETLNDLYDAAGGVLLREYNIETMIDIVNPSGSRSFRHGPFFMMMNESHIMLKSFGTEPARVEYLAFFAVADEVFRECIEPGRTWQNFFGEPEEPPKTVPEPVKEPEKVREEAADDSKPTNAQEEVAEEPQEVPEEVPAESDAIDSEPVGEAAGQENACEKAPEIEEIAPAQMEPEYGENPGFEQPGEAACEEEKTSSDEVPAEDVEKYRVELRDCGALSGKYNVRFPAGGLVVVMNSEKNAHLVAEILNKDLKACGNEITLDDCIEFFEEN